MNRKLSKKERDKLKDAYEFAEKAHEGQKRDSGDDFFEHPKAVGLILAELKLDIDTIVAGLLHDVVEDCGVSIDEIKEKFALMSQELFLELLKLVT